MRKILLATAILSSSAVAENTKIISLNDLQLKGNAPSFNTSISANGRFVTFSSIADNLVIGDNNQAQDIFLRDNWKNQTTLISRSSNNEIGSGKSSFAQISGNGRFVVFESFSNNFIENDANFAPEIFLHDRYLGTTNLISVSSSGAQGNSMSTTPSISFNGNLIAFESRSTNLTSDKTTNLGDIFLHNINTGITEKITKAPNGDEANQHSFNAKISADGNFIAFVSRASNLVENDTNNELDIFVYSVKQKSIERVSVNNEGEENIGRSLYPAISGDGRFVVFSASSQNLTDADPNGSVNIYQRDRLKKITKIISLDENGNAFDVISKNPAISLDGRFVTFTTFNFDPFVVNNERENAYLWDRKTKSTEIFTIGDGTKEDDKLILDTSVANLGGKVFVAYSSNGTDIIAGKNDEGQSKIFYYSDLVCHFNAPLKRKLCEKISSVSSFY